MLIIKIYYFIVTKWGIHMMCACGCRWRTIGIIRSEGTIWVWIFFCNCLWIHRIMIYFQAIAIFLKKLFVWPAFTNADSDRAIGIWSSCVVLLGNGWNKPSSWWVITCLRCWDVHRIGNRPIILEILCRHTSQIEFFLIFWWMIRASHILHKLVSMMMSFLSVAHLPVGAWCP